MDKRRIASSIKNFLNSGSHTAIWSLLIHQIKSFKMIGVILTLLIQVRSVGQSSRLWPNCFLINCWFLLSAHSNCLPFDLINEVGFQCSVCLRKALPSAHLYQLRDSRDRTLIHIKATARRHLLTNSNSTEFSTLLWNQTHILEFLFLSWTPQPEKRRKLHTVHLWSRMLPVTVLFVLSCLLSFF